MHVVSGMYYVGLKLAIMVSIISEKSKSGPDLQKYQDQFSIGNEQHAPREVVKYFVCFCQAKR